MFGYAGGGPPPVPEVGSRLLNLSAKWDANWYLIIARDGYSFTPDLNTQQTIVFFPAYPMLVRVVGRAFGGHTPGYIAAGLLISIAAFFASLLYLYALARETLDDDRAQYAMWLTATYPFALFFSAIYVESLLLLGLVATLYHFRKGQFGRAVLWGVLLGLTKTNGFLFSIPLAMLAVQARGRKGTGDGQNTVAALAAAAAPILGALIYATFVWRFTGDPLAWLKGQAAWGREYHGFAALVGDRFNVIVNSGMQAYASAMPYDLMNALSVVFILVTAWPVGRRFGLPYAVFMLLFILPPLAAGGLISAGRFSCVLFPAFLWMATTVPIRQRAGWLASFAALQALNAAAFYTWRPLY
jgi:hypothetical protein